MATIFLVLTFFYLTIQLSLNQLNNETDIIRQISLSTNDSSNEEIRLSEFSFLPVMAMQPNDDKLASKFDIFKDNENKLIGQFSNIDLHKMKDYLEVVVNYKLRINGSHTYVLIPYRHCKYSDFSFDISKNAIDPKTFFCPDITEDSKEFFKTQNLYNNQTLRQSISIEVRRCPRQFHSSCKNDHEVEDMLTKFMWNLFVVHDKINFHSTKDTI